MSVQAITWALDQRTGKPSGKLLLLALANYANSAGECWPSLQTLMADTELSRRTVIHWIGELERCGLVAVRRRKGADGQQQTNYYILAIGGAAVTISADPGAKLAPGDEATDGGGDAAFHVERNENTAPPPGANSAPGKEAETGCKKRKNRVQNLHEPGAATAPKPLRNHQGTVTLSARADARGEKERDEPDGQFDNLVRAWPEGAREGLEKERAVFSRLDGADRYQAIAYAPRFLQKRREAGRTVAPSLATYLADKPWRHETPTDPVPGDRVFVEEGTEIWKTLKRAGVRCVAVTAEDGRRGWWFSTITLESAYGILAAVRKERA